MRSSSVIVIFIVFSYFSGFSEKKIEKFFENPEKCEKVMKITITDEERKKTPIFEELGFFGRYRQILNEKLPNIDFLGSQYDPKTFR